LDHVADFLLLSAKTIRNAIKKLTVNVQDVIRNELRPSLFEEGPGPKIKSSKREKKIGYI